MDITNNLGIPYNMLKDAKGIEVIVLGYTVDTIAIEVRLSKEK